MREKCAKFIFLIACFSAFCQYAVAQPPERNNTGDDRDLEPWPDDEEEASALASKPNGGSTSAGGDEAAAASGGDGPRAEDRVNFHLSNGHVAVVNTWEAPASQNQAEGFSGVPDPVCPATANAAGQNSHESDADPLQENTTALAGTVDQSVETDNALASDSGTSGATGVESVAALQEVASGSDRDVGERLLWPVQESAQEVGPGWQAEASFDFHTSGGYSESSASEEEMEGEVISTDHYLHDAFQPGLGHYDEKDYINLALQRRLRNGTLRQSDDVGDEEGDGHDHTLIKGADTASSPAPVQNHGAGFELTPFVSEQPEPAEEEDGESSGHFIDLAAQRRLRERTLRQSDDVGDEEGDGHDHVLIKGADTASSPAPVQNHGAGFGQTPFVSEQPEPAEEEDGESSGHFIDLAAQRRLREHFAHQLSLLNTSETEGSDEESSDNGTLLPVQESEESHEGTSTLSFPSTTWSPAVIVQDGVQNGQQAESDHHADIDLHSPDALLGSLDSSQDIDLHANQYFGANLNIHPPYTVESAAGPDPLPSGSEDGHYGDSSQDVDLHGSHGFGTSLHVHPSNAAGHASGPCHPLSSSGDVHHGQQATSDHHADIDVHSPSSSNSSQNAGLDENQDIIPSDLTFAKQEKESDKSSSEVPPQGGTAHLVPLQSTADGIGHVNGNVHYDRQAETDLEMPLHHNNPSHAFHAALSLFEALVYWSVCG